MPNSIDHKQVRILIDQVGRLRNSGWSDYNILYICLKPESNTADVGIVFEDLRENRIWSKIILMYDDQWGWFFEYGSNPNPPTRGLVLSTQLHGLVIISPTTIKNETGLLSF
jgi:hypothetical protein